jgi:hypothetical protein
VGGLGVFDFLDRVLNFLASGRIEAGDSSLESQSRDLSILHVCKPWK